MAMNDTKKAIFFVVIMISLISVIIFLSLGHSQSYNKHTRNLVSLQTEQLDTTERYLWEGKAFLYGTRQFEKGVSLFLYCNISELHLIENIMSVWSGKVSLCVYVHINQLYEENLSDIQYYRELYNKRLIITMYSSQDYYPVNILRNRAVQRLTSELAICTDIYTLVSSRLYDYIMSNYDTLEKKTHNSLFALPLFKATNSVPPEQIPDSKEEMAKFVEKGDYIDKLATENNAALNGTSWFSLSQPFKLESSKWKDPYLLVHLKFIPLFDERVSYRNDLLQWNTHLSLLGFDFFLLPNNFAVQLPKDPDLNQQQEK